MIKLVVIGAVAVMAPAFGADDAGLRFETSDQLYEFLMPRDSERVADSLKAILAMENAGGLVTAGAKVGPAYAAKVAAQIPQREFREGYSDLAKYLDMFGPCQKLQAPDASGWWSNYPKPPNERHCSEATKLVAGALLWNQVHYCVQLVTREVKPKLGPDPDGPRRLDEPPVKTQWLKPPPLYAVADAAIRFSVGDELCEAGMHPRVKFACAALSAEARKAPANRELVALSAAKLLLRQWEQLHLGHLER